VDEDLLCKKDKILVTLQKQRRATQAHTIYGQLPHMFFTDTPATGYVTHSLRFQRFVGQQDLMRRRRQFALKFRAWFGEWRGISVCF
jgi:hypothetical protein